MDMMLGKTVLRMEVIVVLLIMLSLILGSLILVDLNRNELLSYVKN